MEDIVIPMSQGNMEDIDQDGNLGESSSAPNSESMEDSVVNTQAIYERENRIVIDYGFLAEKYRELYEPEEVKREGDKLQRHVTELGNTIQRIQAPNMRVSCLFF